MAGLATGLTGCSAVVGGQGAQSPSPSVSEPEPEPAPSATPTPTPSDEPSPTPSATPTPEAAVFESSISTIDYALAEQMRGSSWREGCPVPLRHLRFVTVSHYDFEGEVRTGEVVLHHEVAASAVRVFERLFDLEYPIHQMRLVDEFGADVHASLAANNTSSFNCRKILIGDGWSEHAYGKAIDVNPVENPYVLDDFVEPEDGTAFVRRVPAPGVLIKDDPVVRAFEDEGWKWGGLWKAPWALDYMHFAVNDR